MNNEISPLKVQAAIDAKTKRVEDAQTLFANKINMEIKQGKNMVMFSIPKPYEDYRPTYLASINGLTCVVRAGGKPQLIHKIFADEIKKQLDYLDAKKEKQQREKGRAYLQNY
jgi:hypothetical protein